MLSFCCFPPVMSLPQIIFSALEKYCLKKLTRIKIIVASTVVYMTDHKVCYKYIWWKWKSLSCVWLLTIHTVHGILQVRILQRVAYPFSRGSSQPRNRTGVSCITGGFFTNWTIISWKIQFHARCLLPVGGRTKIQTQMSQPPCSEWLHSNASF